MDIQREITAAFTGHRTYDGSCDEALAAAIRQLYTHGYRIFLTGMAAGFDLAAGECAAELRSELKELQLHCIVPFAEHRSSFYGPTAERYDRLLAAADKVITLSPAYNACVYHQRNDYLVNNSSAIIAYLDQRRSGGTRYTVQKALSAGLQIRNLWLTHFPEIDF